MRDDVTAPGVSVKREGTGLVLGFLPDQAETRAGLAAQVELTGREDLTRNATLRARSTAWGGQVATQVEPNLMTVRVTAAVAVQDTIIMWSPR